MNEYVKGTLTTYANTQALLEEFIKLAAKVEGVSENEVNLRIRKRADELFNEFKEKINEEAKN